MLHFIAVAICAIYFLLGLNCLRIYGGYPAGYPDDEKLLPLGLGLVLSQFLVGWELINAYF